MSVAAARSPRRELKKKSSARTKKKNRNGLAVFGEIQTENARGQSRTRKISPSSWIPVGGAAWCTRTSDAAFFASGARRERARHPGATSIPRDARGKIVGRRVGLANRRTARRGARASRRDARSRAGSNGSWREMTRQKLKFRGKKQRTAAVVCAICACGRAGETRARPGRGRDERAPAKYITGKSSCVLQLCDPR